MYWFWSYEKLIFRNIHGRQIKQLLRIISYTCYTFHVFFFFAVIMQTFLHISWKCHWSDKYGSMNSKKNDLWINQEKREKRNLSCLTHTWCRPGDDRTHTQHTTNFQKFIPFCVNYWCLFFCMCVWLHVHINHHVSIS